ncbi:MAG TPA: GIY-YIG nuclease family protein [Candidatus Enterosoma merdigallinarum]|nr:GIY-YIG nuclease family protein [Candidatus Enterosoma merdigallinarum]
METKSQGVIYILTNPSFPDYVKIGYADDVNKRLKELNRSECIPFAFRLYAYYEVPQRLTDKKLHELIDMINPDLRAIEEFDGKRRTREFYNMTSEKAYKILQAIAQINGLEDNLHKVKPSEKDLEEEEAAEENRILATNRHHFKNIEFTGSLTGHTYRSSTNERGTLSIFDITTGEEVPNNANPSKREIVRVALNDLTKNEEEGTLYQLIHRLEKVIVANKQNK